MNSDLKVYGLNYKTSFISLIVIFNIILISFPLTNVIGYEFSVLNSIILFLFSGIFTIQFYHSHLLWLSYATKIILNSKIFILALVFIPFFIGGISSLFFSICPLTDGLLFYLVITIPSIFFGISTGYFILSLTQKFTYLLFVIIFIFILFYPLMEIYFNSQVYFFNPLVGFFPGTIYDEDIKVDNVLISYRLFNTAFFIGLMYLGKLNINKAFRWVALPLVFVTFAVFILFKPMFGFSTDHSTLKKTLGGVLKTEHFNIYYSKEIKEKNSVELLGLLHEYYFEQTRNELNISNDQKITSFVFKNENQKRKLFGAGKADIAKPWLNEIYLNYPGYEATLKHEIVHVLVGEFGVKPLKVADKINPALIEGFAMAIENDFDGFPVHYMARLANKSGYIFPIEKLFSGLNFFSSYAPVSYIYSGSFIKYLIDKYGIGKARKLYGNLEFSVVYGYTLKSLIKEYHSFLDSLKIDSNRHKAQLYFGGQPIFKKFCLRSTAIRTKEAWQLYNDSDYNKAGKLFSDVYEYSFSYSSLNGLVSTLIKQNKLSDAGLLLRNEINKFNGSPYYYNLELTMADIYIRTNKLSEARTLYDSLLIQNPHIEYYNQVLIRKLILFEGADSLKKYLDNTFNKKLETLLELNTNKIEYCTLPVIINLCTDVSHLRKVLEQFKERIEVNDFTTSYAALKLSKVALKLEDYVTAKKLAINSLNYKSEPYFYITLSENLKMINWLINFFDQVITHFHYQ